MTASSSSHPIKIKADVGAYTFPGALQGDLIYGAKSSYIATVVERQTRFTILVRVESKNTEHVVDALSKQMGKLPTLLQQSLTLDRGQEMARHHASDIATNKACTFTIPEAPGSAGQMKMRMAYSDSTFQMGRVCHAFLNGICMPLHQS